MRRRGGLGAGATTTWPSTVITGPEGRGSVGRAKRDVKSTYWPEMIAVTVLAGTGKNPGPTTKASGEDINIPEAASKPGGWGATETPSAGTGTWPGTYCPDGWDWSADG